MNIADVLFWGGMGGAVLGGLYHVLKTYREKGRIGGGTDRESGHKGGSYTGKNGGNESRIRRGQGREGYDRGTGLHTRSADPQEGAGEVQEDPELYGGGGGGGGGWMGDRELRPAGSVWDELIVNRRNCDEVRRDVESLKRSFDELNQEVTRRINRANARLSRSTRQSETEPGVESGTGQLGLDAINQAAGGVRLKSDLRKIAQERILAKRGRRL